MITNIQDEAGAEVKSINPTAPAPGDSEGPAANRAGDELSERRAGGAERQYPSRCYTPEREPERNGVSSKFGAFLRWRQRQRTGHGGTLRARAYSAIQGEPLKKVRPERWMSDEERARDAALKQSAAALFRQTLYGSQSGKCDLESVARSVPGESGTFCAFCSSSRPCRFRGLP